MRLITQLRRSFVRRSLVTARRYSGCAGTQHRFGSALDLLAQLAHAGVRFVLFDMKGELEDDRKNRTQFLKQTGARYVRLIQEDLPINPLIHHQNPTEKAQVAYEIANLIRYFAPQLGAKQERNISDCYQRLTDPDFSSLEMELQNSGANGVDLAIIQRIARFNLFAGAQTAIPPERWLETSLVIDFKGFHADSETKALATAFPNPNGIPALSPGFGGTSYPGSARTMGFNPERVASSLSRLDATPSGLMSVWIVYPA